LTPHPNSATLSSHTVFTLQLTSFTTLGPVPAQLP
jgi:hypothetical protein